MVVEAQAGDKLETLCGIHEQCVRPGREEHQMLHRRTDIISASISSLTRCIGKAFSSEHHCDKIAFLQLFVSRYDTSSVQYEERKPSHNIDKLEWHAM